MLQAWCMPWACLAMSLMHITQRSIAGVQGWRVPWRVNAPACLTRVMSMLPWGRQHAHGQTKRGQRAKCSCLLHASHLHSLQPLFGAL